MAEQAGAGLMLGPLEAEVMGMLWRAGRPLPVREVTAALNASRDAALARFVQRAEMELASAATMSVLGPAFLCCAALSQVLPAGFL